MYLNQNPLRYEICELEKRIVKSQVKLDYALEHKGTLHYLCSRAARVIEGMNLVRLPRTWSTYDPMSMWRTENTMSTVCVNGNISSLHDQSSVYDKDDKMVAVKKGKGTVFIDSSPSWEAWRRWPTIYIEQFYAAMLKIREEFGSPALYDNSKTESEYKWEQLCFQYETKTPVYTARKTVCMDDRYGETVNELITDFHLIFRLEIPSAPDDFKGHLFGCTVEQEEVVETRVRTKKRMICD